MSAALTKAECDRADAAESRDYDHSSGGFKMIGPIQALVVALVASIVMAVLLVVTP